MDNNETKTIKTDCTSQDANAANQSISNRDGNAANPDAASNRDGNAVNPDAASNRDTAEFRLEFCLGKCRRGAIIFGVSILVLSILFALALAFVPDILYKDGARGGIKKAGTISGIIVIYALLLLTAVVLFISKNGQNKNTKTAFFTTKNITRTAVFSSLSIVLYYFVKFPVPAIFPSFLDIQFSDLPALLSGYMMGPISGAIVIIIKFLVKLPASGTMCVGETVDLILGLSFVIPASIIYRRKHNIKWAIISLAIGSLICVTAAALANRFIAVPAYLQLMFKGDWGYLLGAMNAIFDGKVTEENFYLYYIFLSVIPFNLLRCLITSLLTFFSYKSLKRLFDRMVKQ